MSVYPPQIVEAAKNLLDNQAFAVLLKYRLAELQAEIMNTDDDKEIIAVHKEHADIRGFAEWIEMLGGSTP